MAYCRSDENGMYIYPDDKGINFIAMPKGIKDMYLPNENINILLYLMKLKHNKELEERIKEGEKLYKKIKEDK